MALITSAQEDFHEVECDNGKGNDEGLSYFKAIDASQDIDGIGAEDSQHSHVDVVQEANVEGMPNKLAHNIWHYHGR